jgi:cupin fold WbuC family metalloprotein
VCKNNTFYYIFHTKCFFLQILLYREVFYITFFLPFGSQKIKKYLEIDSNYQAIIFMIVIDEKLITNVSLQAKKSLRKRQNYNFHETLDAKLQRMLNAIEPSTYVRPHKHENPDKVESFVILKGRVLIVEFDDSGSIESTAVLSFTDGVYGVEIPPRTWHTIISLESGTVVYEIKEGPYSPLNDKDFASWAPEENSSDCDLYIKDLLIRCGITI